MRRRRLTFSVTLASDLHGYRATGEMLRQVQAIMTLVGDAKGFKVALHDSRGRRTGFANMRDIIE